jgi:tetratricopeptide (TPR) repeat protein
MKPFRALIFLVLVATPIAAQTTWESHTRTGEYAFATGDTARAEREFLAALSIAQKLPPGDRRLETSLGNLGRFYEHEGRFEQALPMFQLQMAAAEVRTGRNDRSLLTPLLAIGRIALQVGDIPAAEDGLQRYRSIAEATGAADPDEHWLALAMLARMCTLQDRPEEALEHQRQAIRVLAAAPGPGDLERATAAESLAQMELMHGSAEAAEQLLVDAARLRSSDDESGGIALMLLSAARTAYGAGELDVAQRLGDRAFEAASNEGADLLPIKIVLADIAWMRVRRGGDSLGDLYLGAAPNPELDQANDRLLEIHGAVNRAAEPELARSNLARLAQVAALRGNVDDAAHWQRLAIDLERELSGVDSQAVMGAQENLVGLFMAAGRPDDAVVANAWLIATKEEAWGADSPRLRPILEQQLELLTAAGLKKEAKAVKKRLKKLR